MKLIKPKVTSGEVEEMLEKLTKKVTEKYQEKYSLLVKKEKRSFNSYFLMLIVVLSAWIVASIKAGFSFGVAFAGISCSMIVVAIVISAIRKRILGEIDDFLDSVYDDLESSGICMDGYCYPPFEDRIFVSSEEEHKCEAYRDYESIGYYIVGRNGYFGRYLETIKTFEEYTAEEPPGVMYHVDKDAVNAIRPEFHIKIKKKISGVECAKFYVYAHGEYEFAKAVNLDFSYIDEAYKKAEALVQKYCEAN